MITHTQIAAGCFSMKECRCSSSIDPRLLSAPRQEGNVVPNIGLPLFDCTRVASS